ncbi:glycoside hydrolase family 43 protein [Hymenobacter terricola]|uniref:glycoside hydrolase family 43 protein n=1 Tax=Hymenobacter terricola TaxID=2819236 RepID=UPI001B3055A1|nr:glycoside hydrolase 43 family protein [Hymenobacter terricola]
MRNLIHCALLGLALTVGVGPVAIAQSTLSQVWVPDLGNGTYKNPVLYADYSDPDVVRVGTDYYLVSSSFNCVPGLQILHSKDLVNWSLIGAVFREQPPVAEFRLPQHGNGVWAPAIRYHNKQFYIYYPDPDRGVYVARATNPAGPWEAPKLIKEAKGWIDPCPLWDEDGQAYLVHGFAGSRAGFKTILAVSRMSADGLHILGDDALVFDGHAKHPTLEGPKFYKRHGYYYIFAPAGGVPTGWQTVLRSRNVFGPYEDRIVLDQGNTAINGPHQGAWVDTPDGKEDWFLHFQDQGPYGRVVHLEPMVWKNDWPIIGSDPDGDGKGQPVLTHRKPRVPGPPQPVATPPTSDEFSRTTLGLQWQWHANPQLGWAFPNGPLGYLRLYAVPLPADFKNYWQVPNLLLQKLPAETFTATTKLTFTPRTDGEKVGLLVMGLDYAYLSITNQNGQWQIAQTTCHDADKLSQETGTVPLAMAPAPGPIYLRVQVAAGAKCRFSYSLDGQEFKPVGTEFQAREGKWIGAKIGLFCSRIGKTNDSGSVDLDWWRIAP